MAKWVKGVGSDIYPLMTTDAGEVVLYRFKGDVWRVARDESEVDHLTGLSTIQRAAREIEVVLAKPSEADR